MEGHGAVRGQAVTNGADQNVGEDLRSPVTGKLDIMDIFILLIISSNNITGLDFKHSISEAAQRIFSWSNDLSTYLREFSYTSRRSGGGYLIISLKSSYL